MGVSQASGDESQQRIRFFASEIRKRVGEEQYAKWIAPLVFRCKEEESELELVAPNMFVVRWARQRYMPLFLELLQNKGFDEKNREWKISIRAEAKDSAEVSAQHKRSLKKHSATNTNAKFSDNLNLRREWDFSNFVQGGSNSFAHATALEIANRGKTSGNPVVFYSSSGLGKSHLAQSIIKHRMGQGVENIAFVRSERYFREMVKSITERTDEFSNFYRKLDLLVIDDIQFFAGKERTQDEFFHTFNSLYDRGKQMVFTCDVFPKGINGIQERISSRFGMGLSIAIEPPDMETRMVILQTKARQQRAELSEECAQFIAEKVKSNVRELEGALGNVIARSTFLSKPIDIGLIREALADLIAQVERNVTISYIQTQVAKHYNVKLSDMLSPSKSRSVTRPRQMAMLLAKELTTKSLPEIGSEFGGRDHSTVIYAIQRMREAKQKDQTVYNDFRTLERTLIS